MTAADNPRPRRQVRLEGDLRFGKSDLMLPGSLRNLSISGMLVQTDDPKQPGTPCHFKFDEFEGWGEVKWCRMASEGGVYLGVKIVSMTDDNRQKLIRVLKEAPQYL